MAHRPQAAQCDAHFVMCLPHGLKAAPDLACSRGAAINHCQPLSPQGAALQARRCHSVSRRAVCRLGPPESSLLEQTWAAAAPHKASGTCFNLGRASC